MIAELKEAEIRTLGCLVEKQITTPDHYPLSLNALTNACKQKSNRDPILDLDEKTVVRALDALRDRKLAWMVSGAGSRVPKYEHSFDKEYGLDADETAVLCVLMLRGPQTAGELRARAARLCRLTTIGEVETVLQRLMTRAGGALATKLPRQPSRRERRYAHLLAGEPQLPADDAAAPPEHVRAEVQAEDERIEQLETEVDTLRRELAALRSNFQEFRRQFE